MPCSQHLGTSPSDWIANDVERAKAKAQEAVYKAFEDHLKFDKSEGR